jgi:hypothetical protein
MAARRKKDAADETEVTVRAAPETQVSVETTGPRDAAAPQGPSAQGVLRILRENPVPAGLVWAGLGWLALSAAGAKRPQAAGAQQAVAGAQQAVVGVAARTQGTVSGAVTGAQQRARGVTAAARDRAQAGSRRAREVVDGARFATVAGTRTVRSKAATAAERVRTSAQSVATERPEVLELAAAGAGAVVGIMLPATPQERQLVAPHRDEIIEKADTVAEQVLEKVEQTLEQPEQSPPAIPA